MEISARRGIRIGLKRYALVVNSGVRVSCLEIWFQNRSVAPVSRSLPHRTRRTGEDDHSHHPQRKALTGQNKRTLHRPCRKRFTTSNSSGVTPGNGNSDRLFPC